MKFTRPARHLRTTRRPLNSRLDEVTRPILVVVVVVVVAEGSESRGRMEAGLAVFWGMEERLGFLEVGGAGAFFGGGEGVVAAFFGFEAAAGRTTLFVPWVEGAEVLDVVFFVEEEVVEVVFFVDDVEEEVEEEDVVDFFEVVEDVLVVLPVMVVGLLEVLVDVLVEDEEEEEVVALLVDVVLETFELVVVDVEVEVLLATVVVLVASSPVMTPGPTSFMVAAQVGSYWQGIMQIRKATGTALVIPDWN